MVRRFWAGFLSLLLIVGTLAATPVAASAAMSDEDYEAAARQLNKYGLVQGDNQGYRFPSQITRAEMAKLLVYSLGLQNDAPRNTGRGLFTDTTGHWADGIIAVAKTVGIMKGYPEGDFRPQAPLTYAEVITALSRLVGIEASSEPWPRTYLGPATQAGIIPDEMNVYFRLSEPANRGDVFVLLWRTLTVVKNAQGQNLLRRYLDTSAPVLVIDPQPKETTDLTLTVSGTAKDADQVLVNGTAVPLTFGYFRQDVSLRMGPNTVRIQAVDSAGNVREESVQITRKQSPITAASITGPTQVLVGKTGAYTITIKDQNGEAIADRKSVTAEVTPPALGSFDPVTGVFAAGKVPGSGTILVKAGPAQSSVAVSVIAGDLETLKIDPPEAALRANETRQFSVKGFDAYENPVSPGAVQWSATGGTIGFSNGLFTAPDTPGVFTITASAGGKTATAMVQPPNYQAASVRLSQPASTLKANGMSETTLTATVLDAQGKTLTDYRGSLTVTSTAPGVAGPTQQTVPVNAGIAEITVRSGITPGSAQITATTNLGVSGAARVTVAPQRLQSVRLQAAAVPDRTPTTYPTGYVEAIALDEDGYPMRTALGQTLLLELDLTITGAPGSWVRFVQNDQIHALIALGPLDPATGDVRTRTHLQYTAGAGTILIEGHAQGTMSWVVVTEAALRADQVGLPAGLSIEPVIDTVAGQARNIFVTVLDANGHRVTQASALAGIEVALKDQNGIRYTGVSTVAEGPGRYRFNVTQNTAGTYTYTAILQPAGGVATQTARVIAGPLAGVRVTANPEILPADNATPTTLRAELVDGLGNLVTEPAYRVIFRPVPPDNGALQSYAARTVTSTGGIAEAVFKAGTVAAPVDVQVTVENTALAPVTRTIAVRGVPERLVISYGDNNGNGVPGESGDATGRAGIPLTIFVDVVDRFGVVAAYDHGRQITLTARNSRTGAETTLQPATVVSGRATFYLTSATEDRYALKAQSAGLTMSVSSGYGGGIGDAWFRPIQATQVAVAPDLSVLTVGGGANYALITATLVDAGGNPTLNQTGRPIIVTLDLAPESGGATSYGTFTVDDQVGGTVTLRRSVEIPAGRSSSNSVKFFSGTQAGAKNITWSTADGQTRSFAITSVAATNPGAIEIKADPTDLTTWANRPNSTWGQTVRVIIKDANGNRMTNATGQVTLSVSDADTRIVAYWDTTLQALRTTYDGANYATTQAANVERGQATFVVAANNAGAKLYSATYPSGGTTLSAQTSGMFLAVGAETLQISPGSPRVTRDGTLTLTARIYGPSGSLATNVPGDIAFLLPTGGPFTSLDINDSFVNGEARVTIQADRSVWGTEVPVTIPYTTTVRRASTGELFSGTVTVIVDDRRLTIDRATIIHGPVDPGSGTLNEEDEINLVFSEPVSGNSLVNGWVSSPINNPGLMDVSGTTLQFSGLGGLASIQLPLGSLPLLASARFQIEFIAIDDGVMTIKLGARVLGAAPTLTLPPAASVDVTVARPVVDQAGLEAAGPFTAVPVDTTPPSLDGVSFVAGSVDPSAGTLNEDDQIRLVFSKPVKLTSFVDWLGASPLLSGEIQIAGRTITFARVGPVTQIQLPASSVAANANARFKIREIAISGSVVTFRLGARLVGGEAPVVTLPPGSTADVTVSLPVKDIGGLTAPGPFPLVPVTGNP